jgi:GNAT superfamily N-acetyltransferase
MLLTSTILEVLRSEHDTHRSTASPGPGDDGHLAPEIIRIRPRRVLGFNIDPDRGYIGVGMSRSDEWGRPGAGLGEAAPLGSGDVTGNAMTYEIRSARAGDAGAIADLAAGLAQSFEFSRASFDRSYPALLVADDACLLVAAAGDGDLLGFLLGFAHLTFYANGRVGWVEEVFVRGDRRGDGVGRALMDAFEGWAAEHGCALVALATRRAAPFYRALGYEESAAYFRKVLPGS